MATATLHLHETDGDDWHSPTEVRAALAELSGEAALRVWDEGLDKAVLLAVRSGDTAKLEEFLRSSWASVLAARQFAREGLPEHLRDRAGRAGGREQTIAAWEAAHPGRRLVA